MSNQKCDARMTRRKFLCLSNKAGIALVAAGGILDVIHPPKVFSAFKDKGDNKYKGLRPLQNQSIVVNKSRNNKRIVSSTLAFKDNEYLLNSEGSFLWNLCNGNHSLDMMAEALSLKYKKTPAIVENDIYNFVVTLQSLNLIGFRY